MINFGAFLVTGVLMFNEMEFDYLSEHQIYLSNLFILLLWYCLHLRQMNYQILGMTSLPMCSSLQLSFMCVKITLICIFWSFHFSCCQSIFGYIGPSYHVFALCQIRSVQFGWSNFPRKVQIFGNNPIVAFPCRYI